MALLTPPPIAPQRKDKSSFSDRLDAFITWLINFVTELVSLVANLNSIAAGGAYAIPLIVDATGVNEVDPGAGKIRFNNASQGSSVALYVDILDAAGTSIATSLDSFGASSSSVKGVLRIIKQGDASKWAIYSLAAVFTSTGYRALSVSPVSSSSAAPFSNGDAVILHFQRTGDKGDTGTPGTTPVLYIRDVKANNVAPQSLASGWNTRNLNTVEINEISGASLASDTITLPAGNYEFVASAGAQQCYNHRIGLYNVTDGAFHAYGTNERAAETNASTGRSIVRGKISWSSGTRQFQLRHYAATGGGYGGYALNAGTVEIYSEVWIKKVP